MYNVIGYIIFLAVIFFITIRVGWVFYKNGEVYIAMLLPSELHLVQSINKLLLVGYYLLNLGYTTLTLSFWEKIYTTKMLFDVLFERVGTVVLLLAVMHYFNLFWILIYSRSHQKNNTITNKINV